MSTVVIAALFAVLAQAAPTPVQKSEEPPSAPERRLVVGATGGVHWSVLSGVPSGELSLFLGSSIRPRRDWRGRWWKTALGYELTVSGGGADYATAYYSWGGDYGLVVH